MEEENASEADGKNEVGGKEIGLMMIRRRRRRGMVMMILNMRKRWSVIIEIIRKMRITVMMMK